MWKDSCSLYRRASIHRGGLGGILQRAVLIACAHVALPASSAHPLQRLGKAARLSAIRRAQVWRSSRSATKSSIAPASDDEISEFRFQISDFGFQISDFRFQISEFRFQISDFRFRN
jgi:hypothetical protein